MSETGYTCPKCGSWNTHWIDRDYIQCDNCDYEWDPDESSARRKKHFIRRADSIQYQTPHVRFALPYTVA